MNTPTFSVNFFDKVQAAVFGDNNKVTINYYSGKQVSVPVFLAPNHPPYQLVGREGILSAIKQQLFTQGSVALSALNGMPGVG